MRLPCTIQQFGFLVAKRSKDQATSELEIAFDHAILKNGTEIPLALGIQAIGRSQASAAAMADDSPATSSTGAMGSSGARASGGGMLGGARSTAGSVSGYGGQYSGSGRKLRWSYWWAASGSLSASGQGVIGLPGMSLSTQTSTSTNASVIGSQGSNVHLDSGTEMILRVNQLALRTFAFGGQLVWAAPCFCSPGRSKEWSPLGPLQRAFKSVSRDLLPELFDHAM
jgi:hypothetical protein